MKHSKKNISKKKLILIFAGFLLFFITGFWLNLFIIDIKYSYHIFVILKTVCLILSIIFLIILTFLSYKQKQKKILTNFNLFFTSLVSLFICFELVFSFYTPSTNVFTDLSNNIWLKRHFTQINSLGYRDSEPKPEKGKTNILIVGDSFVAGHGIKYEEMFSNILKNQLKEEYNIFNLGVCGSHTDREFDSLLNYPVKADIIILGYYHNDIESAMIKYKFSLDIKNPKDNLSKFSKLFVNNSLFINYMFTIKSKKSISKQFLESDKNDLLAYLNKDLWEYQKSSLDKFYNYCIENNIKFIVLFFPELNEGITLTNELAGKKLETYCMEKNIDFINIYSDIKNLPIHKRIANKLDNHPSAEVNKIIARKLLKSLSF